VKLTVNGQDIKTVKSAKFLGMIFDRKLTWNDHIDYVVKKCKQRLNLMRAVSGKNWGASQSTQLTIYKALIRSVIDYGAIAYDSASASQLAKLDSIQCQALMISTGAMKGTPLAVLQTHCDEMPLQIRRLKYQIRYAIQVKNTLGHVSKKVFEEHWTQYYGRYNERNQTVLAKVSDFFAQQGEPQQTPSNQDTDIAPWLITPPVTDDQLATTVSKRESPEVLLALAKDFIQSYDSHTHIYTDASKTADGKVGIGCYVEANKTDRNLELTQRVTDSASVFAGELAAIRLAMQTAKQLDPNVPIAIFSDSLSAIHCLSNEHSTSRPQMLQEIYHLSHELKQEIKLIWVPSHIGIAGNEMADRLANQAANKDRVDSHIGFELPEMFGAVDEYCVNKWQAEWSQRPRCHYRQIKPNVTTQSHKAKFANRRIEVTANRLRFGRCRLNAYLYQIGQHTTGLCDTCQVPETVEHYVTQCKDKMSTEIRKLCRMNGIDPTVENVLRDNMIVREICKMTDRDI